MEEDISKRIDDALASYGLCPPTDLLALVKQVLREQERERELCHRNKLIDYSLKLRSAESALVNLQEDQQKAIEAQKSAENETLSLRLSLVKAGAELTRVKKELASERLHVKQANARMAKVEAEIKHLKTGANEAESLRQLMQTRDEELAFLRALAMRSQVDRVVR